MSSPTDTSISPRLSKQENDGPLSKSRLRRTGLFFFIITIIGLLPQVLDLSPALKAAGLSIVFPGAGFLTLGGWVVLLMPLTFLLYKLSLFIWFGTGAIIAPFIVIGGSALLAANMSGDSSWQPALYITLAFVAAREIKKLLKSKKETKENLARQTERQAFLPEALAQAKDRACPEATAGERELSETELANMRYCFERALQPIGQFQGYNKIDQFQTSALRYQINSVAYSLATMQCHYTPNFHGYLNEAQQRLIEQTLERPIWGYWALENMWGNFNFNFDPACKDNIMLTGFFGLQVGLYMSATGDQRYAEPGSLTFKYSKNKVYKHSIHTLIQSIVDNQRDQEFCLYPCEPNWVYTPCNFMGMKALAVYDRLFGTSHFKDIFEPFLAKLDSEFTRIDGSVMPLRSNLTGFSIPFPFADDIRGFFFNPLDQDRALEAWAFARQEMTYYEDGQLKIHLDGKGLDMGNYTKTEAAKVQNIMCAAREFGDTEVADAALVLLDEMYPKTSEEDGVLEYKCSNANNANIARARILGTNDWRNAITQGPSATTLTGPILTDAKYPDVLVAKAYSHTGSDLDLVLYPGKGVSIQAITIERLQMNTDYSASINEQVITLHSDEQGRITTEIFLEGRTAILLKPTD